MEDMFLKGVGKKITIREYIIFINKTIGKNITININDMTKIDFTEGTMKRNGLLNIEWIDTEGKSKKENIFFYFKYNNTLIDLTNKINKYINDKSIELNLEEKQKVSLFQQLNIEANIQIEEKQNEKDRLKDFRKQGIPYCPKCKSTSLSLKGKRLSLVRAAVGGGLFGGAGAVLGGLTSKKSVLICMNCGNKFKPGKR